jgi:uncharacterized glyoxalase superfamily protein PhnB
LSSRQERVATARKKADQSRGYAQYLGGGVALQVDDVAAAVRYYEESFGFDMIELDHQNRYASLRGGKLCFDLVDEHGAGTRCVGSPGEGLAMYVFVDDVERQLGRMQEAEVPILTRVNRKRAGVEEFSVRDRYGLLWIFSQAPCG